MIFQLAEVEGLPQTENPFPRVKHPVLTSDCRACFHRQGGWAWFVVANDGGPDDWDAVPDFEGPAPDWFCWITEAVPWLERLFPLGSVAEHLMRRGVAPGQTFRIGFSWSCGVDYAHSYVGEGWDEFYWELLEVEPLDPAISAERWDNWLVASMECTP